MFGVSDKNENFILEFINFSKLIKISIDLKKKTKTKIKLLYQNRDGNNGSIFCIWTHIFLTNPDKNFIYYLNTHRILVLSSNAYFIRMQHLNVIDVSSKFIIKNIYYIYIKYQI